MSLKKSKGNMYSWVSHTHSHLGGECSHKCSYCYVNNPRFGRHEKYCGPIRLLEDELNVNYGVGKTIFIENMNDLFANDVPAEFIRKILDHVKAWPNNIYIFQTKNPGRVLSFIDDILFGKCMTGGQFGTTIETNRSDIITNHSSAPDPLHRYCDMLVIKREIPDARLFVTLEPIMDFDVGILGTWLTTLKPSFVNIGADSKKHNLPEPTPDKVKALIEILDKAGIEIREKHNLERLLV